MNNPIHPFPIAVFISGNGSNLQAIIDAIKKGLPAEIKVVISNNARAFGLIRAQNANIPIEIIPPTQDRKADEQKIQICLERFQVQLIILAGYMRVLSPEFISHYPHRILNIHPSLLPKYRGLNTHQRVLEAGEKEHGCTVHIVTEELDSGPIIAYSRLRIHPNDTPETLENRIHKLEHYLYPKVIELYARGELKLSKGAITYNAQPLPLRGLEIKADLPLINHLP